MSNNGQRPEEMAAFFDARSDSYDDHMRTSLGDLFEPFYAAVAAPIPAGDEPLSVLDLGSGTGTDVAAILSRAPRARVTCVDLSRGMLDRLAERFPDQAAQLTLLCGSYLDLPLTAGSFDHAVAAMTMHHFTHDTKRMLYTRIARALRPGGSYIEGDYYAASADDERDLLLRRAELLAQVEPDSASLYHIDIPFTLETQTALLLDAGFQAVHVTWEQDDKAIIVATV